MFHSSSNQSLKKSGETSRFPLVHWESDVKHGTRKLTIGPSAVLLILGIVALLTDKIAVGTVLGAGAGVTTLIERLLRRPL